MDDDVEDKAGDEVDGDAPPASAEPDAEAEQEAGQEPDPAEELERVRDELLRAQAEMQNQRRRGEQAVEKAHKYGQERFAGELLTVVDNLERALAAAAPPETESEAEAEAEAEAESEPESERDKAIREGVELTLKSLLDCFKKFAVETVDPLGEPFDPALHQAMSTQESGEAEPDTVLAVMQKGYTLHGRVLRPAMVIVSKPPSESEH